MAAGSKVDGDTARLRHGDPNRTMGPDGLDGPDPRGLVHLLCESDAPD
jgi:hypothetical protein